ncbi:AAA family ATPase [Roseburia faecis]|uniref:AAA family ATPase n=1 Tax=Roseburia faecis TaxID=301302 RepID=UPI001D02FD96|nr:AAA family ATPase [Roseburia faecis]MCB5479165.1 AAA family ATPase [Roseburia faecis]
MRMILKSLHMENFKGIKSLDVNFSNKTSIKGQNAVGKTTIFDAFTWLLFNKNSAGEEKFNVRPLDKDGKRIDNVEIKVVGVIKVDGKEVELSKVQKQNWVKKRGTNTVSLQGNPNSYEIDGYPKSEAEFKAYISGLAQSEEMFKMLTNPQYFPSLKWKDQRDILMKLVAEVSDVELAQTDAKYTPLIGELEKAPSTDDIRAKFSKALSEWKKKQAEIPVRIDEAEKSKVDVDVAEQELLKADLERKIEAVDDRMENAGTEIDRLRGKEMQLQFDMSGIMQVMNDELSAKRRGLDSAKDDATREFNDLHNQIQSAENQIKANEKTIFDTDAERKNLGVEYNAEFSKAFDETPYLFDESKWVFDENSTVCSLCGQQLPANKIEQLKADFEQKKADAKARADKQLEDARKAFDDAKGAKLKGLIDKGNACKADIKRLTKENAKLQEDIVALKEQESKALAKQNDYAKQLSEIPAEADYSQNEEYVKLKTEHDKILADIAKLESEGADKVVTDLKAEKADLQSQLDEVNKVIAQAANNVAIDDRIETLRDEQKEIGQKVADQEQMLYLLEEFIRFKLNKVSESINSHFNFKLFEMQLNGGMKDCCECTVNGVPYSTLNSGHRIVAGLDIIRSLSELYGVSVPIFVDNAESLNEFNVPDMDAQLILLSVSEDKQLKVEGV